MPKFRRTGSMADLAATMTPEEKTKHETTYQASRGGWHKPAEKPVPGTPKKG
ncbi:hypothetical protein [Streptomyces longwoodensis]|uniref:hypothetical protein n=1 Tax=Streptomyces longwoodensis TaxID=68231 RepID=UPI000ACDFFF1|nr:hypothetical protein [Streptomyces longwoodensis]